MILLLKLAAGVIAIVVVLVVGALLAQRPPLLDPPGPAERLVQYLRFNEARIESTSRFPELRPPTYALSTVELADRVAAAAASLGWAVQGRSPSATGDGTIVVEAVVTTPVLRFHDDVRIEIGPGDDGRATIEAHSASRVGKADFGVNAGHLRRLLAALEDAPGSAGGGG